MFFIRFLISLPTLLGQKFELEGDSSTITFMNNEAYSLYNEDSLNIVDDSSIPALTITQSSDCTLDLARRMIVHGSLLGSTSKSFQIQGFEQWKLIKLEDFQGQITGWSHSDVSNCGTSPDLFLGGHCKFSNTVLSKTFVLPAHKYLKIQFSFHFLDKWESESAYLKLDGNYVWTESYTACNNLHSDLCIRKGVNVCGDDYPDRMGFPVRVAQKHDAETVTVEISTNLKRNSCEVSWGIDDLQIYIR